MESIAEMHKRSDLRTAQGAELFIQGLLSTIKKEMAVSAELAPFGVVLGAKNPDSGLPEEEIGIHYVELSSSLVQQNKDAPRIALTAIIEKVDGFAAAFVSEAWMLKEPFGDKTKPRKSIADHPDRIHVVMVHFEHLRFGNRIYFAEVSVGEGGHSKVDEFVMQNKEIGGRFVNMLPHKTLN